MSRVFFVCLHDAARSQMSEALLERALGRGRGIRDEVAARVEQLVGELDLPEVALP